MKPQQPPGPAMTLANMRELGVQNLIAAFASKSAASTT